MKSSLLGLLHVRPGEWRRVVWLSTISVAYAAATSLGDDIAQSVFVTRAGADALPRMFLFKGALDVAAAALYLPLTRKRSPGAVWRIALCIYMATLLAARVIAAGEGIVSAYALYVAHECVWTILTIHWGVFILDAFNASQARRLFPLLFTAARLGDIASGMTLHFLAVRVGAIDLLLVSVVFAGLAAGISLFGRKRLDEASDSMPAMMAESPDESAADEELTVVSLPEVQSEVAPTLLAGWRRAASSPLVRIIAVSTAAMVLVRYGLRMVSIDEISQAFYEDEDMVAGFLGWFGAWANLLGAILGVLVVPKLLARFGVGVANVAYAVATVMAYGLLLLAPSLGSATAARFCNVQLKNSLKTPLSTLFYGAEPPANRVQARAFIFGAVIPLATLFTAATFELASHRDLVLVAVIGMAVAVIFTVACAVQNRRWRVRLGELLAWKLSRAPAPDSERLEAAREALAPFRDSARAGGAAPVVDLSARLDQIARALASSDDRLRAVGEELLAETIPRARAHAIARPFVVGRRPEESARAAESRGAG